jgi:N-methylhydantoinase A
VVNAYLSPLLKGYIDQLAGELIEKGFGGELFVMQSNGGSVSPDIAGENGCASLLSGPAAGVVAAARLGRACGAENVIGVDMGGTSYDVSLVHDGVPETRAGDWFNRQWIGLPMLGIHTVGAGGGSLAWIDPGGALRVGPQSAGARPGPACYGFGGEQAAVTDAFLALGYLNPDYFLGGKMPLYPDKAEEALRRAVGEPLGMDAAEAAFSVYRIVNNNMANAIRYVSVARGLDPRDFTLMSFGGAGSITVGAQARDLGISRIVVPRSASVLCALGELWTDLKVSQQVPLRAPADAVDTDALSDRLAAMAAPYVSQFERITGVGQVVLSRTAELHYDGQSHEIMVPMEAGNGRLDAATWRSTVDRFHQRHEDLYAFQLPGKPVEVLSVGQDIIGVRGWELPDRQDTEGTPVEALKGERRVCFDIDSAANWFDTPIYDGARLAPGAGLVGPAIIEEVDTTIALQPGDRLVLNQHDVYEINVASSDNDGQ